MSDWGILLDFLNRRFSRLGRVCAQSFGRFLPVSPAIFAGSNSRREGPRYRSDRIAKVGVLFEKSKPTIHEQNRE